MIPTVQLAVELHWNLRDTTLFVDYVGGSSRRKYRRFFPARGDLTGYCHCRGSRWARGDVRTRISCGAETGGDFGPSTDSLSQP
jgi:hypothetical protein